MGVGAGWRCIGENTGTGAGRLALYIEEILYRYRHARERRETRAGTAQCIECIGLTAGTVGIDETKRSAAVAAVGRDPFQSGFGEFAAGRGAGVEQRGEVCKRSLGSEERHGE